MRLGQVAVDRVEARSVDQDRFQPAQRVEVRGDGVQRLMLTRRASSSPARSPETTSLKLSRVA